MSQPRVVIAHDFMETYGGAERVTGEIARAFPDAAVVAILGRASVARRMRVEHRFHSLLPARSRLLERYRLLTPVYPAIADHARLPEADVLVSSSYAFAHRLRTANDAPRVCYCHSPLRFAWTMTESYRERMATSPAAGLAFRLLAEAMRRSDRRSARRVDRYLTQSPYTAQQIERFYGRRAEVIGAPVNCDVFRPTREPPEDYFLVGGRLVEPYKRISVAIEAFRRLGRRLVIVGDGPALGELRAGAPPNVEFAGHLDDYELVEVMSRCAGAVFPSRDDFGLMAVEVMACGRPVLAYSEGGARYTVKEGVTGAFFREQTPEAIAAAVRAFRPEAFEPKRIREHVLQWDSARFRERLCEAIAAAAPSEPETSA